MKAKVVIVRTYLHVSIITSYSRPELDHNFEGPE